MTDVSDHVCLCPPQLQRPSDQEVEDFLNRGDFLSDKAPQRTSANSLFLKAMDGRPCRRRRSLQRRSSQGSGAPQSPDPLNGRRSSLQEPQEAEKVASPGDSGQRRPSPSELLLPPLKQFVSQSQKVFEYLSPHSPETDVQDLAAAML